MSDETPSWWPPVWHDDGGGDRGWYPFREAPFGRGQSEVNPFVREWRVDKQSEIVRKGRYAVYKGKDGTFRTDCLLEVLTHLIGLTQRTD